MYSVSWYVRLFWPSLSSVSCIPFSDIPFQNHSPFMPLYRPTLDGVVAIYTYSINPITRTRQKQLNMSLPTSSSPSRNTSSSRAPTAPISTSVQSTQGQSSQTSTAKKSPYQPWVEPKGDAENLRFWYRHYKPIQDYEPPVPKSPVPGPTESLGPLTNRKRLAGSAPSFERTKVSRPDTGTNPESISTEQLWANETADRLLRQRDAEIAASFEPAEVSLPDTGTNHESISTATLCADRTVARLLKQSRAQIRANEAQSWGDDVTATDHLGTSQVTARSESYAHSARVGAIGQVHEREQNRAKSTRLGAEQTRLGDHYQTDISISASSITAFPRPRHDVPSSTDEAGDIGRAWIQEQKREMEKEPGNQGQSGYWVDE